MGHKKIYFRRLQQQINRHDFKNLMEGRMRGPKPRKFSYRNQFDFMLYCILNKSQSLREGIETFNSHENKIYHSGFKQKLCLSTVSEANSNRSYEPYQELFFMLQKDLSRKHTNKANKLPVKIIDSTTFTFSDRRIMWAKYNSKNRGLKIHLMLDEPGFKPEQAHITTGKTADVTGFDKFDFEEGNLYVMDRAYLDSKRLYKLNKSGGFFIVRMKDNIINQITSAKKIKNVENVLEEKRIQMMGDRSQAYEDSLRAITIYDPNKGENFDVITNHPKLTAKEIADLYRRRWAIEIFFRWFKQVLKINKFYGISENAIKMQIWISLILCLLLWKMHRQPEWKKFEFINFLRRFRTLLFHHENKLQNKQKPPPNEKQIFLFGEKAA